MGGCTSGGPEAEAVPIVWTADRLVPGERPAIDLRGDDAFVVSADRGAVDLGRFDVLIEPGVVPLPEWLGPGVATEVLSSGWLEIAAPEDVAAGPEATGDLALHEEALQDYCFSFRRCDCSGDECCRTISGCR